MFLKKSTQKKVITLDDVVPLHPDEYPAKGLRARLERRHEFLEEIRHHNPSEGLQESSLGLHA